MSSKLFKFLMGTVLVISMVCCFFLQKEINTQRNEMDLTRVAVLDNAPPLLAFTTVALGGFRGLIVNVLWERMTDLGDQDRYFETIQLSDWITKLEPTFLPVWSWQAWNMSYNISIKFSEPLQRWHWVYSGIKMLRDEGLRYNPNRPELYRELSWMFQHKIGHYMDECHMFYKGYWAQEMDALLGEKVDWDGLLTPVTEEQKARVQKLKDEYKMDPEMMKLTEDKYGPLEWRLPDAHAIYWATVGLEKCKDSGEDLMPLKRSTYQPLLMAFHRGRLVKNRINGTMELRPNLDMIPSAHKAYLEFADSDPEYHDYILKAHKNFLKDAIYFLYSYNRIQESASWFQEFAKRYPDQNLLTGDISSKPDQISLDEFVVERVAEDIKDTSPDRVRAIVDGMLFSSFYALAMGEEEEATGNALMAAKVWEKYMEEISDSGNANVRMSLPPFQSMRANALKQFLQMAEDSDEPQAAAILREKLNLPPASLTEQSKGDTNSEAPVVPANPPLKEFDPDAVGVTNIMIR